MERRKSILGSEGKEQRLIVISNRLPITCKKENGKWTFTRSSGGSLSLLPSPFPIRRSRTSVVVAPLFALCSFASFFVGLVAALSGLNYSSFIWIGWPGIYIDQAEERAEVRTLVASQFFFFFFNANQKKKKNKK